MKKLLAVRKEDLNLTPPAKRLKTDGSVGSDTIPLFTFLSKPLLETRNKQVEVINY